MAKPVTIKTLLTDPITFEDSESVLNVARGGGIFYDGNGMAEFALYSGPGVQEAVFNINGSVAGALAGIGLDGAGTQLHIGKTGFVYGQFALYMEGVDQVVTNAGQIRAAFAPSTSVPASYAVSIDEAERTTFINTGVVSGPSAFHVADSLDVEITNAKGGIIVADDLVIDTRDQMPGQATRIVNLGTIQTLADMGLAVYGGAGDDTIINRGKIYGIVDLAHGNDTFDALKGQFDSSQGQSIFGGGGDDTLILSDASYRLVEDPGEGYDTIKSSVAYNLDANVERLILTGKKNIDGQGNDEANTLYGNAGNNMLYGGNSHDVLRGFKGTDRSEGGAGLDTFVFGNGDGRDTIADFNVMEDTINLVAWTKIDDIDDLKAHATDKDGDVVITVGKDVLIIENFVVDGLSSSSFSFHT